jgi:predicted lysophospholipase L1 biosynthesis ABC-type transport system permease subunit
MVLRPDRANGRVHSKRSILATVAATAIVGFVAAFVGSAVALTTSPSRYGFDVDLVALNAYGDQGRADLQRVFARRADVDAATAYTAVSLLLNGRAVPGLATTAVKREALPTRLQGRVPRNAWEIAAGRDTVEAVGAEVGDLIDVQVLTTPNATDNRTVRMRLVGVVTFPPISQVGTDMPRLGTGALLTHGGLVRAGFNVANGPEFTSVRLVDGASPRAVIAANPKGFQDVAQSSTVWLTDAKPSELRQLLAAMPYLRGALAVAYAVLLGVIAQALWSLTRANRHDLAVLRVAGCVRRQLDTTAAWQVVPFLLAALVVGVPAGTVLGLSAYRWFARSLAVVDAAPVSWPELAGLVVAVVVAGGVAVVVAIAGARRVRTAAALREA